MPTYEYECEDCGHRFEVFQRITEDPISLCEKCNGPVQRILFPVGILFKGSGFHVNDYKSSSPTSGNGNGAHDSGHKESTPSDSKVEEKSEKTADVC